MEQTLQKIITAMKMLHEAEEELREIDWTRIHVWLDYNEAFISSDKAFDQLVGDRPVEIEPFNGDKDGRITKQRVFTADGVRFYSLIVDEDNGGKPQ